MESSVTEPEEPSKKQAYVQVPQADNDTVGPGQDACAESRDDSGSGEKDAPESTINADGDVGVKLLRNAGGKPVVLGTSARLWNSSVHLIPMALSAFLIVMNTQRWYWYDEEGPAMPPDAISNMLQFAAKVYELLVIASLGALTVKLFKRRLVESHMPLGLLTGAYRVGDIPYVFSTPFWKTIRKSGWLALFLFINTMVATLAGPSSAILMVPELDWYPLAGAFSNVQPPFYYGLAANKTWPRVVSAALLNQDNQLNNCDSFTAWYAFWCPGAGYSDLWNWLAGWTSSDLDNDPVFQDPTGAVRRRLAINEGNHLFYPVTAITTVSLPPFLTFGRLLNFIESGDIGSIAETSKFRLTTRTESPVFQPLVQTRCSMYDWASLRHGSSLLFPNDNFLNCLGDPDCEKMLSINYHVDESAWNMSSPRLTYSFYTGNITADEEKLVFFALATIPYRNGTSIGAWVLPCTMIAHWVPASLSISPGDTDLVQSNVTDALGDVYWENSITTGTLIKIKSDWLDYLVTAINITLPDGTIQRIRPLGRLFEPLLSPVESANETLLVFEPGHLQPTENIFEQHPSLKRALVYVQKISGAILTEGLARVASASHSYVVYEHNDTAVVLADIGARWHVENRTLDWSNGTAVDTGADPLGNKLLPDEQARTPQELLEGLQTQLTRFDFEAERYGYGSGKVGPSMDFALAVVYIYLIIVGAYFLHVVVLSRLWRRQDVPTIVAWGDVADLLLLAWNSKPSPHRWLSQSSVEVANSNAWRVAVGIRAETATGRTQLATSNDGVELLRKKVPYH